MRFLIIVNSKQSNVHDLNYLSQRPFKHRFTYQYIIIIKMK